MRGAQHTTLLANGMAAAFLLFPFFSHGSPTDARPPDCPTPRPTALHRVLWYMPNRLLDLADIFRLRIRVGPGLAVNARVTQWATLFTGEYHAAFVGLPGPRREPVGLVPAGLEQEKGIQLFGVDATDTLPHEPVYSKSEITVGAQVLVAGAEAGFDPVELVDFLLGFALLDIRKDDH